jgi:hypothetical protein
LRHELDGKINQHFGLPAWDRSDFRELTQSEGLRLRSSSLRGSAQVFQ